MGPNRAQHWNAAPVTILPSVPFTDLLAQAATVLAVSAPGHVDMDGYSGAQSALVHGEQRKCRPRRSASGAVRSPKVSGLRDAPTSPCPTVPCRAPLLTDRYLLRNLALHSAVLFLPTLSLALLKQRKRDQATSTGTWKQAILGGKLDLHLSWPASDWLP